MTYIILVRHGQNDWVTKHRLAGWIPGVHLNKVGVQQAKDVAARLAPLPITAIYSSPVTRCMETATHITKPHKLRIKELPDVGEVRYGKWEGKKISTLSRKRKWIGIQHYPSRTRFPNGETLLEVQFRAVSALEKLATQYPKEALVVVSHADVIKLILAHYLGVHIDLFQRIGLSPASISILALSGEFGIRVLRINDNGPLSLPSS